MALGEILIDVLFTLLELVAFVLSVIGNISVIYEMIQEKNLKRKSNLFIISIAVCDLGFGLIANPLAIYNGLAARADESLQKYVCLSLLSFEFAMTTVSVFSIIVATVDRYFAICHPHSYEKKVDGTITTIAIVICWILGVAVGGLPIFVWKTDANDSNKSTCTPPEAFDKSHIMFLCFSAYFVPVLILILGHLTIFLKIRQQTKLRSKMVVNIGYVDKKTSINHENEEKCGKTLSMIAGKFVLCWFPLMLCLILKASYDFPLPDRILTAFIILSHYNSAISPVIYIFRIPGVGATFRTFMKCWPENPPQNGVIPEEGQEL